VFDSFEGQQFELDSHSPLRSRHGCHRVRSEERANVAREGGAPTPKLFFPDGVFELGKEKKKKEEIY
jgi:hypothetical protein